MPDGSTKTDETYFTYRTLSDRVENGTTSYWFGGPVRACDEVDYNPECHGTIQTWASINTTDSTSFCIKAGATCARVGKYSLNTLMVAEIFSWLGVCSMFYAVLEVKKSTSTKHSGVRLSASLSTFVAFRCVAISMAGTCECIDAISAYRNSCLSET